jgi:hypothetical protein
LLDLPVNVGLQRARRGEVDRFEQEGHFRARAQRHINNARSMSRPVSVIDATPARGGTAGGSGAIDGSWRRCRERSVASTRHRAALGAR